MHGVQTPFKREQCEKHVLKNESYTEILIEMQPLSKQIVDYTACFCELPDLLNDSFLQGKENEFFSLIGAESGSGHTITRDSISEIFQ